MSTYKGIRGLTIHTVDSDPSPLTTGDIWYSTAFRKIRGAKVAAGAWASGGDLNTARWVMASAGTQTAGLCISGAPAPPGDRIANVESYDGSSWTEIADVNNHDGYLTGHGSSTAAHKVGGFNAPTTATEIWDNSSWTEVNDINTGRGNFASAGTTTAGICFGGNPYRTETETWNGTSWSEVNDLNTGGQALAGAGTATAAMAIRGRNSSSPVGRGTELFNGTSWTEITDSNTARQFLSAGGISTSTLAYGGDAPGASALTESYDGSSWTEVADLATARGWGGSTPANGTGSNASAIMFGGSPTGSVATEEWDGAPVAASSFTSS